MKTDDMRFMQEILPSIIASGSTVIARSELQHLCGRIGIKMPNAATQVKPSRGYLDLAHMVETADKVSGAARFADPVDDDRTDDQVQEETDMRFRALDRMATGVATGKFRAIIVSGDPGIGKTYNLEYILGSAADREEIKFTPVHGYVKPTGIFRLAWEHKNAGDVLMFDDADSVFNDEIGLNLLKAMLDSTKRRTLSWHSEKDFDTSDGEIIPKTFEFKGSVIFVTNLNFDREISRSNKNVAHLLALMSRAFYLDLNMSSARELMIRIKSVIRTTDMLMDIDKSGQETIIAYMDKNQNRLRELSLRMAIKLGQVYDASKNPADFMSIANATCLKRA